MELRALATRLERTVSSCCAQGLSWNALWASVKGPLAEAIPFEGAAFAATDPTTLLPTAAVLHGLPTGYCPSILDRAQLFALLAATRPAREHLAENPPTIVQTGLARPASRDERRPSVPGASGPKPPSTRGSL